VFDEGEPILVDVVIRNDLSAPIRFSTFALQPNEWNGETAGIELVSVRRLPDMAQIWQGRPVARPPLHVAGQGSHPVPPRAEVTRRVDLSKWTVVGGWIAGRYEASLRVDAVELDARAVASVTSEMFEIRIQAPQNARNPMVAPASAVVTGQSPADFDVARAYRSPFRSTGVFLRPGASH